MSFKSKGVFLLEDIKFKGWDLIVRILYLINSLNLGGAEKLVEQISPIINQSGDYEVEVLLLTDQNNVFYESLIEKGVMVKISKFKNIYDPRSILEISKYIKKGKYDIVHSHLFPTQYWLSISRFFNKNDKVKYITTEHNTYNRRRKLFFFRPIDKFIYSKYDLIISISEKTKDNLIKWIDPRLKKTGKHIVIENGVDLESIESAKAYNKIELINNADDNIKLVCMAGRFTDQKDQPTLIKAISKLPENTHLLLLGDGREMLSSVQLAKDLSISNRVHFLGYREDVAQILKSVDIVVLSSHWEGLSLSSIEGMASGKPFVASNVEGLFEVVSGYGLVFEKGNEEELASLIKKLSEDKQFYNEIAKSCKKRALDFSIQRTVDSLLKVYRKV